MLYPRRRTDSGLSDSSRPENAFSRCVLELERVLRVAEQPLAELVEVLLPLADAVEEAARLAARGQASEALARGVRATGDWVTYELIYFINPITEYRATWS